jgi:hypothetical protein
MSLVIQYPCMHGGTMLARVEVYAAESDTATLAYFSMDFRNALEQFDRSSYDFEGSATFFNVTPIESGWHNTMLLRFSGPYLLPLGKGCCKVMHPSPVPQRLTNTTIIARSAPSAPANSTQAAPGAAFFATHAARVSRCTNPTTRAKPQPTLKSSHASCLAGLATGALSIPAVVVPAPNPAAWPCPAEPIAATGSACSGLQQSHSQILGRSPSRRAGLASSPAGLQHSVCHRQVADDVSGGRYHIPDLLFGRHHIRSGAQSAAIERAHS